MYRVFSCLATEHDYWLVALAAVVCVSTTLTTFMTHSFAVDSRDFRQFGWSILTGVCAGTGIWATHFVAMLAYDGGFPTAYDPVRTLASLLIAVLLSTAGFALAARGSRWLVGLGGAVIGAAIGCMHYVGMTALMVPGALEWDASLVGASWVFGVAVAYAALHTFHRKQDRGVTAVIYASAVLTLAICGLHFTSMGAVSILPDPTVAFQASELNRPLLAMATAGITSIVLLSAIAAGVIHRVNVRCESALREQNSRFDAAVRYLPVGLSMFDAEHRLIMCNASYRDMYGLTAEATQPGTAFDDIMRSHAANDPSKIAEDAQEDAGNWIAGLRERLSSGKAFTDPIQLSDGRTIFVRVGPIAGGGWVDVHEDITERSRQDAKIAHMARHDMLTGLPNRTLLQERLGQALQSQSETEKTALLFLDLDRFKEVNDTLGHSVGDALLKEVAQRLRDAVRKSDTVARVGGDEFVVMLSTTDPNTEPANFAARIIDVVSEPYEIEGQECSIGTSVGIAISNGDIDQDALVVQADLALYRSKSDGRGTYRFFEEEMNTSARLRRGIEHDLRSALANGEFELNYQPLVNLERNEISGFEALLRWRHRERGLVSPADFIPIAEESGLIIPIGEWVLRQACSDAATWPDHVKVAVNLSPVQFKGRALVQTVFSAVAAAAIAPSRLELEITESALLSDSEETLAILRKLSAFGVKIAMDDFGTGYSSLRYLRSFPFDKIKIDKSFISGLFDGESSLAIVRAISGLGRALDLSITAEGVETQEQLDVVRKEGCTEMQGFLFSKPKPASELQQYFSSYSVQAPGDVPAPAEERVEIATPAQAMSA
ncbi:EAL domain-containing protein [Hyphomicrobium sp.]|uniref:EAL domain-containing protein n=1 Tax=Hyphomicrobium sp. TaxID=82 RepID=UPI003F72CE1D